MLRQLLEQHRKSILSTWIDQTIKTYEPEMVRFLRREKNPFANPVRSTILKCSEKIFNALLDEVEFNEDFPGLEDLIKLRTVQDFSPSKALSFLYYLKPIIRKQVGENKQFDISIEEIFCIEDKIDKLTGLAFNIYTKCRNKIYEIRLAEIKSQSKRAFDLLGREKY